MADLGGQVKSVNVRSGQSVQFLTNQVGYVWSDKFMSVKSDQFRSI